MHLNEDKLFNISNYICLTLFFIIVLYPCLFVVSASLSKTSDIGMNLWLVPSSLSLKGYIAVLKYKSIWTGYANSIYYMIVGTTFSVLVTLFAAYPLARRNLVGRNIFTFFFIFTMMFNGGMIPTYLLVKSMGILNTRWAIIIPGMLSVWNMIITRTYIQSNIPNELIDAASVDGCSDIKFFWRIMFPLSKPIIVVIALFYAVGQWNDYFKALLYLKTSQLFPLPIILRDILIANEINEHSLDAKSIIEMQVLRETLKYSIIVVTSLPVMIMYPFVQKYFVKGMMVGSIKG